MIGGPVPSGPLPVLAVTAAITAVWVAAVLLAGAPFGAATILVGLIALVLVWRTRAVRYLLASSLAAFGLGNALFSVLFAWPRNVIMFEQGAQVHSVSYLEQIAQEFMLGHWVRLVASLITAILAGAGFLTLSRRRLTAG
ncbi:hypothetical protein ACO0LV_15095 [Pseudactinotalea sp. Z1739]|uniref:hypothetical protein n=1 Tax=Pseudactinotalea sp. Z1739 TaxID=3413028 RepID=UPI003C7A7FD2